MAAGQPGGPLLFIGRQIHLFQNGIGFPTGLLSFHTTQVQGAENVFFHGGTGENTIALRDEADLIPTVLFPVGTVKVGRGLTVDEHFAILIAENASKNMGKGRFAAAAFAGNGNKFSPIQSQVDSGQTHHNTLLTHIVFG